MGQKKTIIVVLFVALFIALFLGSPVLRSKPLKIATVSSSFFQTSFNRDQRLKLNFNTRVKSIKNALNQDLSLISDVHAEFLLLLWLMLLEASLVEQLASNCRLRFRK